MKQIIVNNCGSCRFIKPDPRGWSQGECQHPDTGNDIQTYTLNNQPEWCPLHNEGLVMMSKKRAKDHAVPLSGVVIQMHETLPNGVNVLTVSCADYDEVKKLPNAVLYNNKVYGRTGWNSDKCIAYYRDDARVILALD